MHQQKNSTKANNPFANIRMKRLAEVEQIDRELHQKSQTINMKFNDENLRQNSSIPNQSSQVTKEFETFIQNPIAQVGIQYTQEKVNSFIQNQKGLITSYVFNDTLRSLY